MRLRQIAFVAKDLKATTEELCDVLGLDVAYRDPGVGKWGLENIVAPIGGAFLEIVSPVEEGTSAGRYLDRRHGDGGYMVILQCPDAIAERKRITGMGIRAVATADRTDYFYTHFHPADVGGYLLSVDSVDPKQDWLAEDCLWPPAHYDWVKHKRKDMAADLVAVELQSADPVATADLWGRVLNQPIKAVKGVLTMKLTRGAIRFVKAEDGRGNGIGALDIKAANKDKILAAARKRKLPISGDQVTVVGCRINLV
jgi:hypothetical protein